MSTKIRLLFLVTNLGGGGAERFSVNLLRYLSRSRFDVTLAVVNNINPAFDLFIPSDLKIIDLKCSRVRYSPLKILKVVWTVKPDVIFTVSWHLSFVVSLCKLFLPTNIRFVARETGIISLRHANSKLPSLLRFTYRVLYNNFDAVVCQSRYMADDLISYCGLSKKKVALINNPVDKEWIKSHIDLFDPFFNSDCINLVAAGRLVDVKGFDILIEAVSFCTDLPIHLTILGDGPLFSKLANLVYKLNLGDYVTFAGFVSNPFPYFAKADAFIMSSKHEGFPNVVLESLACGTPVISTPAPGGILEILDSIECCVISKRIDSTSLAEAVRFWVKGGREKVSEGDLAKYEIKAITSVYDGLFSSANSL